MKAAGLVASFGPRMWSRRRLAWSGGLFIAVIIALAVFDIVRGYRSAVDATARELESQARVLAEQATRSMQAVDVVLGQLVEQFESGRLATLSPQEQHAYLAEKAVGLVQIDALVVFAADGSVRAVSSLPPDKMPALNVATLGAFDPVRTSGGRHALVIDAPTLNPANGAWVFPMGRPLRAADGSFAGAVGAPGRIDYFQQFYRAAYPDAATRIALVHRSATLLARHPPVDALLGQRLPAVAELLAQAEAGVRFSRGASPIDGIDRFASVHPVADYPLAIVVTRDAAAALAPWRAQALGSAARTIALALLATMLIAVVIRQVVRLNAARHSLETSRERYALAAAGSDDGIWDWDLVTGTAYESAHARELQGLPPGPETQPLAQLQGQLTYHPDDAERRAVTLQAHLDGKTPAYEVEYRVRHPDGAYRWIRVRALCVRAADGRPLRIAGSVSDVDVRRRAEEALRESEERYALAMTGSRGGHWVWEVDTDRLFGSGTLHELFDLPVDTQVTTRRAYFANVRLHPGDAARISSLGDDLVAGRVQRADFEYRIVLRDGSARWILTRSQAFRSEGRGLRIAGVSVDISERKRTEEALRESEERFALAVEGSNDGIVDWDIVHDRLFISARALQILGIASDTLVRPGAEWSAMLPIHPDDRVQHDEDFRQVIVRQTGARSGDYRMRQADGRWRWVRVRGTTVRDADDRAIRWAGSVTDIDVQKRTEEALRRSEERYQLAVEGSSEGLWDWDLVNDMLFLSARAQRLTFLEPGEPLRPRNEWIARTTYHPDDVPLVRRAIVEHLRGATPHYTVEYRLQHHSGAWRWYRQRGVAVRDAEGKPYRMAGSMEDISARKHAEAERDRLELQLRQAQKLEAIGTLAGGIAHDFNNILAAILGYGELAQRDAPEGTPLRRHIDAALSAGQRAKSLVERILAFSRSGIGERVPVHVQAVVSEALDAVAASMPPGVRLDAKLAAGDAGILGDPVQLHQVVLNLCANAVQAMKSEGVLSVAAEVLELEAPLAVATSTLPAGRYVRLVVGDTGSGIAPHLLERIFDPFFTTKEVGVGTGLGLSLVHGIVTDLGGGIAVDSRVDAGSVFTVWLPWQSYVAAPAELPDEPIAPGLGETVLLVDDEEALVRLGEETLAELGYEPVGFASSVAALEAFRADPDRYDALMTDEAMPGLTGSELIAEIRRLRPGLPVVLMSGYVTPALSARARELGVVEVLGKPLVARDIARCLAAALCRRLHRTEG